MTKKIALSVIMGVAITLLLTSTNPAQADPTGDTVFITVEGIPVLPEPTVEAVVDDGPIPEGLFLMFGDIAFPLEVDIKDGEVLIEMINGVIPIPFTIQIDDIDWLDESGQEVTGSIEEVSCEGFTFDGSIVPIPADSVSDVDGSTILIFVEPLFPPGFPASIECVYTVVHPETEVFEKTLVDDPTKSDEACFTGMPIGALTTTMCTFSIQYIGESLLIVDTVPAEWVAVGDPPAPCTYEKAGKGNPSKSATIINCGEQTDFFGEFKFETRQSPGKGHKVAIFAPTSCDKDLKLNEGALALDPETLEIIKTSNMIGTPTVDDDNDTDCDQVENDKDNCPTTANPDQTDTDGDGVGDACEACVTNDQCLDKDYCAKPVGADPSSEGVCEERPTICTLEFIPVCGVDGDTYPNSCSAAGNGVNIAHAGICDDP